MNSDFVGKLKFTDRVLKVLRHADKLRMYDNLPYIGLEHIMEAMLLPVNTASVSCTSNGVVLRIIKEDKPTFAKSTGEQNDNGES